MITDHHFVASSKRDADSKFVVSMWHNDYASEPRVIMGFFADENEAKRLVSRNDDPWSMAIMYSIEEHDKLIVRQMKLIEQRIEDMQYVQAGDSEYGHLLGLYSELKLIHGELGEFNPTMLEAV
jgi:hypothetical protein